MRQFVFGLFLTVFVKHIILQAVIFTIIWGINTIFDLSINYWIPAAVLFVIAVLLNLSQLLMINSGKKQIKKFSKSFDDFMDF